MNGSYFDRISVGEVKQKLEAQIVEVLRELEEECAQQQLESLRFIPQKGEIVRANKTWASVKKETGNSKLNAVNLITIQTPFVGQVSLCLGQQRRQPAAMPFFWTTRTPVCPKVNKKKPPNCHSSKKSNAIVSPKKRKTIKKLKQRCMYLMWLMMKKPRNPLRARQPACQTKEKTRNKYTLGKIKEPAFRVIKKWRRARYIAPKKGKQKGTKVKHCKNETTPPGTLKCWNIVLSEMKNVKPPAQQQCI